MGGHLFTSGHTRRAAVSPYILLIPRLLVALVLLLVTLGFVDQPVSAQHLTGSEQKRRQQRLSDGNDDTQLPDLPLDEVFTSDDVYRMLVSQVESNIAVLQRVHEFDLRTCAMLYLPDFTIPTSTFTLHEH